MLSITTASILTGIRGGYHGNSSLGLWDITNGNSSLGLEVVTMVTDHWDYTWLPW